MSGQAAFTGRFGKVRSDEKLHATLMDSLLEQCVNASSTFKCHRQGKGLAVSNCSNSSSSSHSGKGLVATATSITDCPLDAEDVALQMK